MFPNPIIESRVLLTGTCISWGHRQSSQSLGQFLANGLDPSTCQLPCNCAELQYVYCPVCGHNCTVAASCVSFLESQFLALQGRLLSHP